MMIYIISKLKSSIDGDNSTNLSVFVIFIIIVFFIVYGYINIRKRTFNCEVLQKNAVMNMSTISDDSTLILKDCHIKTAYNCCCTGDFRNDYVDYCGLLNCAKQGFRAIDFQIFSINGQPVVSETTVSNNNYKEMYNSLPFNDVMSNVKRYFIQDTMNCRNRSDPLFLIFRFKTSNSAVFNIMSQSIHQYFGNANPTGSMLVTSSDLDNVRVKELKNKVIIIIDTTGLTANLFESSKLYPITALTLGTITNQIYRESDVISNKINDSTFKQKFRNDLNVIYPDISAGSENYDFVTTGIDCGIQFIGMNAQSSDDQLLLYNTKYFNTSAFIAKTTTE